MANIKHDVASAVARAVDLHLLELMNFHFVSDCVVSTLSQSYDKDTVELIETTVPMITQFVAEALTNSTLDEAVYGIETCLLELNGGTHLEDYLLMIENKELTTD